MLPAAAWALAGGRRPPSPGSCDGRFPGLHVSNYCAASSPAFSQPQRGQTEVKPRRCVHSSAGPLPSPWPGFWKALCCPLVGEAWGRQPPLRAGSGAPGPEEGSLVGLPAHPGAHAAASRCATVLGAEPGPGLRALPPGESLPRPRGPLLFDEGPGRGVPWVRLPRAAASASGMTNRHRPAT